MKNFFKDLFSKSKNQEPIEDNTVLISAISLMIEVSLADEIMDISEIETLKKVLLEEFDVSETSLDILISDAKNNQSSSTSLYEFTRRINDEYEFNEKKNLILSMWKIAYADGNIDKYEEYVIRKVSDLIYISHTDFIESKHKARGEYENRKT